MTDELRWWKSSRSGNQGACVEVATNATAWYVRDSKDAGGGRLVVERAAWQSFVRTIKAGAW